MNYLMNFPVNIVEWIISFLQYNICSEARLLHSVEFNKISQKINTSIKIKIQWKWIDLLIKVLVKIQ